MANPSSKAPTLSPWRMYEEDPEQKSSGFFGGALGGLLLAIGVGAIGAYALDYHRHKCDQCGSRWGHFGAFNLDDESSHTCGRCGQVQWWKCGAPHVVRGSQFVAAPAPFAPAFTNMPTATLPPEHAYTPAVPQPTYVPAQAPASEYATVPVYAQPAPPQYVQPAPPQYVQPAPPQYAYVPQAYISPAPSAYASGPVASPPRSYTFEYARQPEYGQWPEYAHHPEYARSPRFTHTPMRALAPARVPSYAQVYAPEHGQASYGQAPEPSTAVALRPKERWR